MKSIAAKILLFIACIACVVYLFACSSARPTSYSDAIGEKTFDIVAVGKDTDAAHDYLLSAVKEVLSAISDDDRGISDFNSAIGRVYEGEENILGEREKYVSVEVNRRTYDAVLEAKRLYALTNETFNVCSGGLSELWATTIPTDAQLAVETMGVNNPLLLLESVQGGKYYLDKSIYPEPDGSVVKEHTFVSFSSMSDGFALDCAIDTAGKLNVSGFSAKIGTVAAFTGKSARKDGKWLYPVCSNGGISLIDLLVPGGYSVAVFDVDNGAKTIGDLYVGGAFDPMTGVPTTLLKIDDGQYVRKNDYVVFSAVVARSAAEAQALCLYSAVTGERAAEKLKETTLFSFTVTRGGNVYVTGAADYELKAALCDYKIITQ
ncbi:MAG: FAD:protein FMN transferase [Firmicutes bacterium]|nr:FAD:protein FMN transferase [Bacillota bacterium]MDY5531913.1 FAD:protein FMN transferase [Pumilibacteraceae bacterium]